MEELIQLIGKTYGLVGLFMVAPIASTVYLWRHVIKQNEHINKLQELRVADANKLQESRVSDAQKVTERLMVMIKEDAELTSETNSALDQVRDLLSKTVFKKQLPARGGD